MQRALSCEIQWIIISITTLWCLSGEKAFLVYRSTISRGSTLINNFYDKRLSEWCSVYLLQRRDYWWSCEKLTENLDSLCRLDICYAKVPRKPMLQTKVKINGNPAYYHCYPNDYPKSEASVDKVIFSKWLWILFLAHVSENNKSPLPYHCLIFN